MTITSIRSYITIVFLILVEYNVPQEIICNSFMSDLVAKKLPYSQPYLLQIKKPTYCFRESYDDQITNQTLQTGFYRRHSSTNQDWQVFHCHHHLQLPEVINYLYILFMSDPSPCSSCISACLRFFLQASSPDQRLDHIHLSSLK